MKRTALLLKSLTKLQTDWAGMKSSQFLVTLAGLMLAGFLTTPAFSNGQNGQNEGYYKATIAPTNVASESTTSFTFTVGNCQSTASGASYTYCAGSPSGQAQKFSSVKIVIPTEFTNVSVTSVTATDGNDWQVKDANPTNGIIELQDAHGNNKIPRGGYVQVVFTAHAPKVPCNETVVTTWQTQVFDGRNWKGQTFKRFGSDPTVSVSDGCGADMPVNKLIDGISAVCDNANTASVDESGNGTGTGTFKDDPDTGFKAARPCAYSRENSTTTAIHNTVFLSLSADDPRFEISVYPTVNGLPSGFPSHGPKIPPQFDTPVPWGFHFTMCEMIRTDLSPVYSLIGVTITSYDSSNNVLSSETPTPYYLSGTLDGQLRSFSCFNSVGPPDGTKTFAVTLNNSAACTVTQGGWGSKVEGNNPLTMLWNAFNAGKYPSGVRIGNDPGNYHMDFTGFSAVQNYLPAGKTPGALTSNITDPSGGKNSPVPPGVFGGQVLTLKFNLDIGSKITLLVPPYAGNTNIGGLTIVTDPTDGVNDEALSGTRVSDLLVALNKALGGTALGSIPLPNGNNLGGFTIGGPPNNTNLNYLADQLNQSYHVTACTASDWATKFLR